MAMSWKLGYLRIGDRVERHVTFAYDDVYAIQYFGANLEPYWKRQFSDASMNNWLQLNSPTAAQLIFYAAKHYVDFKQKCEHFDSQLVNTLNVKGGSQYATLGALAYRQTFGGCKLTWNDATQTPWYFLKEISSDGDLSTVDVLYPA